MNKQQLIENLANAKNVRKNARINYHNSNKTVRQAKKALKLYNQSARNLAKMEKITQFVDDMLEELTKEQQ